MSSDSISIDSNEWPIRCGVNLEKQSTKVRFNTRSCRNYFRYCFSVVNSARCICHLNRVPLKNSTFALVKTIKKYIVILHTRALILPNYPYERGLKFKSTKSIKI